MWIGFDSEDKIPMLKLYMNLRHQSLVERWQKIADIIVCYSTKEMEETIRFLIEATQKQGVPIGIGVGVGKEGIKGLRIYISFQKPELSSIHTVYQMFAKDSEQKIRTMIKEYEQWFSKSPQTVLTLDFLIGNHKKLHPIPVRLKTELSLCELTKEEQAKIESYIKEQMKNLGYESEHWKREQMEIRQFFPHIFYQYFSYGTVSTNSFQNKKDHITLYFEPLELRSV